MKTYLVLVCLIGLTCCAALGEDKMDTSAADGLGWKLAVQAWSFNKDTFFDAVDKTAACGIKCIEGIPGQKVSKDIKDGMGPGMSAEAIKAVKDKLAEAKVSLVAFGVCGLSKDEAASRKTFDWCKEMGIEVINTEAHEDAFPMLAKLCKEFNIKVGLHNHPKQSYYWSPDKVAESLKDVDPMIGSNADTGHWVRSGLNPVECLKKLEGRIVSSHFKDLKDGHDTIWGTGNSDAKAMLAELKRQGFKGVLSAEYEHNWGKNHEDIAQCAKAFHKICAELVK